MIPSSSAPHPRSPRLAALLGALALLGAGCTPDIPRVAPPATVTIAQFDPTRAQIPLPNDLLLTQPVASLGLAPAQAELITAFQARHGFPNDQEVPITLTFTTLPTAAGGAASAPDLDLSTFTPQTFFVTVTTPTQSGLAPLEPLSAASYTVSGSVGTLTLHRQGRLPWAPGEYAVFVRGGAQGVKTRSGDPVWPSQVFYLIAQGQDLTAPANLGLLAAQAGSVEAALPLAQQLNGVIALFNQAGAFAACDAVFPHQELAIAATFAIAPLATQVELDPGRGLVPLPIDLLRHPGPTGKLTALAACTLASGKLSDAGTCSSAAAAGFAALDGFSTTGAILAPTSDLVRLNTVNGNNVLLYDLTDPTNPVQVLPNEFIAGPCEFASSCTDRATALTPVVALQPAGGTSADPTSVFRTRPLKDATDYAVVISNRVLDKSGLPLQAGTAATILTFKNPLVDDAGVSQLSGVDDETAGALEVMRRQLAPVLEKAATNGVSGSQLAMAYTFRTQTILSTAVQLAALPYAAAPSKFNVNPDGGPSLTVLTPEEAFARYGVTTAVPGGTDAGAVDVVLEARLTTLNLLDPASGAFRPNPASATPEVIDALIAVPRVPARTGTGGSTPLVVFRHGLGGGRAQMLLVANTFAARGFVVAAIDAAKHGDRSLCNKGSTVGCAGGAACVSPLPAGAQGDAAPPGTCPGGLLMRPVTPQCLADPVACGWDGTHGVAALSANFLISANFFRSRDTFRQDLIDQSQLIHVLAPVPPSPPAPTGNPVFDYLLGKGIVIDPAKIGFVGQSLGTLQGTASVAANPRITSAVLNVGGGTTVDVFTNSPAFQDTVNGLLAGLGIAPGTSAYLQFLVVAKTILDPADPVNFAGHIQASTLPNLLTGGTQAPKKVLSQSALCDQVVPNPFNYILASNLGASPTPLASTFGGPGTFQVFMTGASPSLGALLGSCASVRSSWVSHGFLADWVNPGMTARAQGDAAQFLLDGLPPPVSFVALP